MLKVDINEKKAHWGTHPMSLSWINKDKETGEWKLLYVPSGCRTYLSCYWYQSQVYKDYCLNVTPLLFDEKKKNPPPSEEYTGIFFGAGSHADKSDPDSSVDYKTSFSKMKKRADKNILILNKWEEKYGLEKTTFLVADDPTGVRGIIFIGDPAWRSELWKSTLYSFLLKTALSVETLGKDIPEDYDERYWKTLNTRENFETLFSQVKSFNDEILMGKGYDSIHVYSGFYSILDGENEKMRRLLFKEEKKDNG